MCEFVNIRRFADLFCRTMFGQQVTGFVDAVHQGLGPLLLLEIAGHFVGDVVPELFAAFFVDGFVAYDGKIAGFGGDENQYIVMIGPLVQVHAGKIFLGGDDRISDFVMANENMDPAAGLLLSFTNGGEDRIVIDLG